MHPARAYSTPGSSANSGRRGSGRQGISSEIPQLEPHVGGHYRINMRMSTGQVIPVTGTFQIIDRPRTLALTWGWEGDPSRQSLLTLTFTDKGGKTELTLRQEGLGSRANRDDHARGWGGTLSKLQAVPCRTRRRPLLTAAPARGTPLFNFFRRIRALLRPDPLCCPASAGRSPAYC